MKYYSEKLNKFYDTPDACEKAEADAVNKENLEKAKRERELALAKEKKEKEIAARKALADEVDVARKSYLEAQKAYREKLEKFCKQYGTYHYTVENGEEIPNLFDFFGNLLRF